MRNGKFINTVIELQNHPRWDEFPSKIEDNVASHSFRVAVYTLIASLLENKMFGEEIDATKAVCRAVFHDIKKTKTGPINYNTKKDPEVADIIKDLETESAEEIVSYLPESLQAIFRDFVVSAEDDTTEGRLIDAIDTFDSYMYCHRENLYSSVGVMEAYMDIIKEYLPEDVASKAEKAFEERMNQFQQDHHHATYFLRTYKRLKEELLNSEFESVRWLVRQVEEKTECYQFLMNVMNMDTVRRWKGKFNMIHDDDAIHGIRSTSIAIYNAYLEKEVYGIDVDVFQVAAKMLGHDLVEGITGDVLGPVKHSTPERKAAFERYEKYISEKMVHWLPQELRGEFHEYMVNAKSSDYEGYLVSVSDKLDALVKTNLERLRSNSIEQKIDYYDQLKGIKMKFDNPSTVDFIAYILSDMEYQIFDNRL
ncbi:HD domain-containing protein (plasmid) [Pontibacillus sp. ALD_SL1]|uniref:YfbR-like 5'-deoxynucleotidase n=1 Tax=Pontibacillus sp. ALD_SL1 TaxID=2777185 RepID=UPI001A957913|nr:YfbR-like 5'-deoxynucleotidase [Pontibacillus sp. ALD_SL1]QST03095.1 HD domain-containing protein [Pontibacillus sp. ALD_SL1]